MAPLCFTELQWLLDKIDWRTVNPRVLGRIRDQRSTDTCWAEAIASLLSALRILVNPTEEYKDIPAKSLLKICTKGTEKEFYVELALETCLWTKIEVGRRKENCAAIGFGTVKGDEEDYIISILKRTPVVVVLHYSTFGLQVALSDVVAGTIYAPKRHVIKKQMEKMLKTPGEIGNHAALLIGAETDPCGVNYWIVQDSRGLQRHDNGIFFVKRPSSLAPTEGNAIYQAYYPLMKDKLQPKF
ncbi:hypothetical protein Cgig2_013593 [Carnegiea gigantea]|uniref:Peptidase C1A papain C-terminal domain-containing protein n=1 Tax=Carnegiea gigantea TaxID=171969 RepID=A0A9Q1QFS7_9CARY|nr:hypothetical protein Cgig2_013593 [Carnegiea gigantea]